MNFYAHLTIARQAGESAAVGFGAMVPDLARMARVRMPAVLPDDIARGVWLHHRTDEAFHANREFLHGSSALRAALDRRGTDGLGPGARRAIAHVGWELMLDGVLARRTNSAWWVGAWEHASSVAPVERGGYGWTRLSQDLSHDRWPERYADTDWIAERLVYILGARPRLAFDPACTGAVADALGEVRAHVDRTATAVVSDVLGAVRAMLAP
ncbi:MAG: hypothetical protein AB7L13_03950 [Acidimicrobiia bacterium]